VRVAFGANAGCAYLSYQLGRVTLPKKILSPEIVPSDSPASEPTPAEGLRLITAFITIRNQSQRKKLIEIAEQIVADQG
jgi:hypothetical protein